MRKCRPSSSSTSRTGPEDSPVAPAGFLERVDAAWSGRAAVVATAAAAVVLAATWHGMVLLVAGEVFPAEPLTVVLLVAALVLRRSRRPKTSDSEERLTARASDQPMTTTLLGWPMTLAVTALTVGAALSTAGSLLFGGTYTTLTPEGPNGCRVIVRETSFLFIGGGEMYLARGGTGIGHKVGEYSSDDGYRPASSGTYELTWTPRGSLQLEGSSTDPLLSGGSATLDC